MDQRLQDYIEKHSFCPEYLFKDWEVFLDVLYAAGGRVTSILWWDRCKKSQQRSSVGSGGYTDPDDPEYMYAETGLWKDDLGSWTLDAIKEYVARERATGLHYGSKYASHDLVPSFYLCE